jgi:adenylate kinase family enzyme
MRVVVVGNSSSGKSTLAKQLGVPHLDLDTVAWWPTQPPTRRPIAESAGAVDAFTRAHDAWVIEGCYADLAELVLPRCTQLVWLDPGVDACLANARARPWEPHKYESRQAQDANLAMLEDWIRGYATRDDACSRAAHRALFEQYAGPKLALTSREAIAVFSSSAGAHRR